MAEVDLHLHTTASDGRLSPTELVRLLAKRGLRMAAITDHDTTNGLDEAFEEAANHPGLTLIPGIELSADVPGNEVHMLGYHVDRDDEDLQSALKEFRAGRVERGKDMVDRLAELGLPVSWERVQKLAQGTVGRPHIAQAMVERGYIEHVAQAFDKYLGRNGLAYSERVKLTPEGAVRLITQAGGVAVLAHPIYTTDYIDMLPGLKAAGLVGMEVHYSTLSRDAIAELERVAKEHDLLPCGGSDYHAMDKPDEALPGQAGPPLEVAERLADLAGRR
jgi:predicted metal-dependent phosphoesterase TrpH